MTNLLYLLASAIATAEGYFASDPNARPRRLNNPGDLRSAPWLPGFSTDGGYWHARSAAEGIAGLYHQIALDIARGVTLRQLISKWAPAADDNDTGNYVRETARRVGLELNSDGDTVPLWQLLEIHRIP